MPWAMKRTLADGTSMPVAPSNTWTSALSPSTSSTCPRLTSPDGSVICTSSWYLTPSTPATSIRGPAIDVTVWYSRIISPPVLPTLSPSRRLSERLPPAPQPRLGTSSAQSGRALRPARSTPCRHPRQNGFANSSKRSIALSMAACLVSDVYVSTSWYAFWCRKSSRIDRATSSTSRSCGERVSLPTSRTISPVPLPSRGAASPRPRPS